MDKIPERPLLRVEEVARFWNVSRSTIYRWCDEGILHGIKKGGSLRITREEAQKVDSESG